LTEADLASQFQIESEETDWAGAVARSGPSMVVLLTQLRVFQSIGHFLLIGQIPVTVPSYIANADLEHQRRAARFGVRLDPGMTVAAVFTESNRPAI
jgi:hypothetical protein